MEHNYKKCDDYPMCLTQLPGFEPTELELMVANNLTFQKWRRWGIPDLYNISSGLLHERFDPKAHQQFMDTMTPTQVGKYMREVYAPEATAIHHLSAQIRRECQDMFGDEHSVTCLGHVYSNVHWEHVEKQPNPNHELLRDFGFWLTGNTMFEGFRWERHLKSLGDEARETQVATNLAAFRASGTSTLVLVLPNNLPQARRQKVAEIVRAHCAKLTGVDLAEEGNRFRHLPTPYCLGCDSGLGHDLYFNEDSCQLIHAIPVIDCGSLGEVKAWVEDESLRNRLDFRELTLPRAVFRGNVNHPLMAPSLTIFDLRDLEASQREQLRHTLGTKVIPAFQKESTRDNHNHDVAVTELLISGQMLELIVVASTRYFGHCGWQQALVRSSSDKETWFAEGLKVTGTQ